MMNKLIFACAVVTLVFADVSHLHSGESAANIVRQSSFIDPDGSYQYAFDTDNGISVQEQASVRQTGPEEGVKSAQGSYSYTSPEGEKVFITYVADENGYQPQGSHIPVAPPIPEAIAKALAYNAANSQRSAPPGINPNLANLANSLIGGF